MDLNFRSWTCIPLVVLKITGYREKKISPIFNQKSFAICNLKFGLSHCFSWKLMSGVAGS